MIDSHCHLADDAFEADLEGVVDRARSTGLSGALCIIDLTNPTEIQRLARVRELWPEVRCAAGVHPHQAGRYAEDIDAVESQVRDAVDSLDGLRAVGEIGLDYHYDFAPRELQQTVFRRQVALARELSLPVVIHTREADDDTVRILRDEGQAAVRGVFHCFTGDAGLARQALDLGFHVSFSGIVTFRGATQICEAAAVVPADRLLAETDAPYLAPVPHRGKRNEPAWVAHVIETLGDVRNESAGDVARATTASVASLFEPDPSSLLR